MTGDRPRPRGAPSRVTAIYVRLTALRRDSADQGADLRRWADRDRGPVAWYVDRDAAPSRPRPGFDALRADVRARRVARVVVWRADRLGLTCRGLAGLLREFARFG